MVKGDRGKLQELDSLTGQPKATDILLYALPLLPYSVQSGNKALGRTLPSGLLARFQYATLALPFCRAGRSFILSYMFLANSMTILLLRILLQLTMQRPWIGGRMHMCSKTVVHSAGNVELHVRLYVNEEGAINQGICSNSTVRGYA